MSAPAPTPLETEDGTIYVASDGTEYKTRSGAWKKNKRLYAAENPEPEESSTIHVEESRAFDDGEATFTWSEFTLDDEGGATEVIPGVLKAIQPGGHDGKLSKKELEMAMQTS